MPKATVPSETVRKELVSLPDGFVVLKRMSYGDVLFRRGLAQKVEMTQDMRNQGTKMHIEVGYEALAQFDFSKCIIEHNLEDENGEPLNLHNIAGVKQLDPQVGQEIEKYIDEMHEEPGEAGKASRSKSGERSPSKNDTQTRSLQTSST